MLSRQIERCLQVVDGEAVLGFFVTQLDLEIDGQLALIFQCV